MVTQFDNEEQFGKWVFGQMENDGFNVSKLNPSDGRRGFEFRLWLFTKRRLLAAGLLDQSAIDRLDLELPFWRDPDLSIFQYDRAGVEI